jgi:hypothetical protein
MAWMPAYAVLSLFLMISMVQERNSSSTVSEMPTVASIYSSHGVHKKIRKVYRSESVVHYNSKGICLNSHYNVANPVCSSIKCSVLQFQNLYIFSLLSNF